MPSLDRGEPAGTLQTLFQDMRLAASSDRSATSISVQPAHTPRMHAQQQQQQRPGRGSTKQSGTQAQAFLTLICTPTRFLFQAPRAPPISPGPASARSFLQFSRFQPTLHVVASTQDVPQVTDQHATMASPWGG